ncbi:MAG: TIGR03790 family protein, partial [Phycisphaerales bacterium]
MARNKTLSNFTSEMTARTRTKILITLICCGRALALEPNEILIVANADIPESGRIARYYSTKRSVPNKNILELPLGADLSNNISRKDYETRLAGPIRKRFFADGLLGKIRCLLTIYGVPMKVGGRGLLEGRQDKLRELESQADKEKEKIDQLEQKKAKSTRAYKEAEKRLAQLQIRIDRIKGRETGASVDSELALVLFDKYELYRWQPNILNKDASEIDPTRLAQARIAVLMVSRLDGPSPDIARGLVDKALAAEETGLKGTVYIDSRGLGGKDLYSHFDRSLHNLAAITRSKMQMPTKQERTEKLFAPGSCPQTAIYCGWYSVRKYVDAFEFVDGAVGYHIASFEAVNLRDPNS